MCNPGVSIQHKAETDLAKDEQTRQTNQTSQFENGVNVTLSDDEESSYPRSSLEAWDKLGHALTRKTKELLSKQSSIVRDTFRKRSKEEEAAACRSSAPPLKKRRKLNERATAAADTPIEGPSEITDDDDSSKASSITNNSEAAAAAANNRSSDGNPLPEFISEEVNRMARMSKYLMEIEYCHRMLREEIKAMENEDVVQR